MLTHLFLSLCLLVASCFQPALSATAPTKPPRPISIVVSIPPLKGIAVELAKGINVNVQTLIPVGVSEHGYEIPASKFRAIAKADIIIYVGLGLEPGLAKYLKDHPADIRTPREQVEFAALIPEPAADSKAPALEHNHDEPGHIHGPDCDHDHHTADPHLWLDPANMKLLVPAVRAALERVLKKQGEYSADAKKSLDEAETSLMARIGEIDTAYSTTLAKATSRTIVVAHNAYSLLARRYNLETIAIAGLHASEPTTSDVKRAIETITSKKASVVYVEPQLSRNAAQRVAKATGSKVLVLDPVGGEDWFAMMNKNLDALAAGLGIERMPKKE